MSLETATVQPLYAAHEKIFAREVSGRFADLRIASP